ncbi:MAG: iron-containing alcohol dehydrogenase [Clostridia bacterium]|nr:iron-containing alcohol dehydrogenase [Clostridia bacterium]
MDFNLSIPVNVISGENCIAKNSEKLLAFGKRCIIVTGGKSALLSGALKDVSSALEKENIQYTVFSEVGPNPLLSVCRRGGELARSFGADFVLGIGGGSPLDAAKAVAVFAANEKMTEREIYTLKERNRALPIVLVGTTAGTGSEVGRVSVLSDDETGRKKSIAYEDCNPALTFADSRYTHSMPYSVTVSTALDALCHALEGYFSSKCTDIPTMFGEKGVSMIWQGLKQLRETKALPEKEMRAQLYYGSLYAGITLAYCGTAFPHPLGYVLTENYGVAHGTACAVFLCDFMKKARLFEKEKTEKILSLTNETFESFCQTIEELLEVPEIKMTEEEIEKYCSRWSEVIPNNFRFTPGGYTKDEAQQLFIEKFM